MLRSPTCAVHRCSVSAIAPAATRTASQPRGGQPHDLGPAVGGVEQPMLVPAPLEVVDEFDHRALGDLGTPGHVGNPVAVLPDGLEDLAAGGADIGETGHVEPPVHLCLHGRVGGLHQRREVRVLTHSG